jgi:hypothetical protein
MMDWYIGEWKGINDNDGIKEPAHGSQIDEG